MVEELTEEGHAGRHVGIVGIVWAEYTGLRDRLNRIGQVIQGVHQAAFFAEFFGLCPCLIGRRGVGRQVRKHAREGIVLSGRPFPQTGKSQIVFSLSVSRSEAKQRRRAQHSCQTGRQVFFATKRHSGPPLKK